MDINFEKGVSEEPKGHAFLYFRNSMNPEEIWATYIVMLPIDVNISKYMPPFLMNQMGDVDSKDLTSFAFPPAPEKLENFAYLEDLAEAREDDIIFGGNENVADTGALMMIVQETVQLYRDLYGKLLGDISKEELTHVPMSQEAIQSGLGVNDVLYSLMSEADKLNELTKLIGRLRFAMDGGEESLVKDAEVDITLLSKHLPDDYKTARLTEVVKSGLNDGEALANLYLQRCFHIVHEEYVELGKVEEQIKNIKGDF